MSSNLQVNDAFMNRKLESQEIYGSVSIVILKRGQVMSIKDYRTSKYRQHAHQPYLQLQYIQNFQVTLKNSF